MVQDQQEAAQRFTEHSLQNHSLISAGKESSVTKEQRGRGKRGICMFCDNSERLCFSSMTPRVWNGSPGGTSSRHDYTGRRHNRPSLDVSKSCVHLKTASQLSLTSFNTWDAQYIL